MKRLYISALSSTLIFFIGFFDLEGVHAASSQLYRQSVKPVMEKQPEKETVEGELLVEFKSSNTQKQEAAVDKHDMEIEEKANLHVALVTYDADKQKLASAVKQLEKEPAVAHVQPNYHYTVDAYPNDPYYGSLWGLSNTGQRIAGKIGQAGMDINLSGAWALLQGRSMQETVVAVLDTGIDIGHPDLAGGIWSNSKELNGRAGIDDDGNGYTDDVNGWDFYHNNSRVYNAIDKDDHGTHVAGTIAASINNSVGITGIAPNVKILPVKFIGPDGGSTFAAIQAIQYAEKMGAKIVNCSWSGETATSDPALERTIQSSKMLFVAAAGNEGKNNDMSPSYPASYTSPNILSVAAIDNQGRLASFSNYGRNSVDVAAPGESILSTVPRGFNSSYDDYAFYNGTSMATPHVSGIAALMMGAYPQGSKEDIIQAIKMTGKPLTAGGNKIATGKTVDADAALDAYLPVDIISVKDINVTSEYIEGDVWRKANVSLTIGQAGQTMATPTDENGHFKIKIGKLQAGTNLTLRAASAHKQSEAKTIRVQTASSSQDTVSEKAELKNGFYDLKTKTYLSLQEFKRLDGIGKKQHLTNGSEYLLLDQVIYASKNIITMNDRDLMNSAIPIADFQAEHGVNLADYIAMP